MALVYLFTFAVFLICQRCHGDDVHFYVGAQGSKKNTGLNVTLPLRTISEAVTVASRPDYTGKDLFIELLPGYHELDKTLYIGQHHGKQLTLRSYKEQEVHIVGGKRIPYNSFKPVTDHAVLAALPQTSRRLVKYVHLPDLNITNYGAMSSFGSGKTRSAPLEVFVNGKPCRIARWPNKGFTNIVGVPDGRFGHTFKYNSTRPLSWKILDDIWTYGFWYYGWNDVALKVDSIDSQNMMVQISNHTKSRYGFRVGHYGKDPLPGTKQQGGYFRFLNVLSELDEPGEYYLDKKTGNLYVWMPTIDGSVKPSDVIVVSIVKSCIQINNHVHNVILSNFVVEACREKGILGLNINRAQIQNMEIRNTGSYGIYFTGDSRNCIISKTVIHDVDGGIFLSGGNRKLLISGGNTVEDCEIYRYVREGAVQIYAVRINGVGHVVRYCTIHDGQSTGVDYAGNDHIIEYNNIYNVCTSLSNCGAIHSTQDWTFRDIHIRYNTIHHISRTVPGGENRAIMLDNQVSAATITNNVLYNNEVHIQIGGGRDNIVSENVMYNATKSAMQVDGRGRGINANALRVLDTHLHNMPYNASLWTSRYPALSRIESQNKTFPEGNQIRKNFIYNTPNKLVFQGLGGWVDTPLFFNITDTGYSYGEVDHYDVHIGDFRLKCHAVQWANKVNFKQVVTPNDVGPRHDIGPTYNRKVHKTVSLGGSSNVCPTFTPATTSPMPSYLPDGSGQKPLFKVYDEGCWLHVEKCANDPQANGTYRDMYGERLHNAANNEAACLQRAVDQWHFCGSKPNEPVVAIYGPTGATTYGGDGCFLARYGCPKHGGPSDGHVIPGGLYRDYFAERTRNAANNETTCLARALDQWVWCGSNPNHTFTAIFRPTGASRTSGAGCWIKMEKCPTHSEYKSLFYDAHGSTNAHSDDYEPVCFDRAEYYWRLCGSDKRYPVTAIFRPTTGIFMYPTN